MHGNCGLRFLIGPLKRVLTHAPPTGYTRAGITVKKLEKPWQEENQAHEAEVGEVHDMNHSDSEEEGTSDPNCLPE